MTTYLPSMTLDFSTLVTTHATSSDDIVSVCVVAPTPDRGSYPIVCQSLNEALGKSQVGETVCVDAGGVIKIVKTEREIGPPCPVCGLVDPRCHDRLYHARKQR